MKKCFLLLSVCTLLSLVPSVTAQPTDIRQGLVAYWPLDTTDGTTTPDATSFGNHLNLANMDPSNFVPGRHGNAASFNGADELLSLIYTAGEGNGLPVYNARKYTVMLWVNGIGNAQGVPPGSVADRRVFSEGSTAANAQLFNIGTDSAAAATRTNVVDMFIRDDANVAQMSHRKSTGMAFDGAWHHIAWVEEDGQGRLYIDGQLDATGFNYTRGPMTLNTISVGGIQRAAPGNFFTGLIDDVGVWERPLTQSEIQNVMTNSLETPVPQFPPVILIQPAGGTRVLGDRFTFAANVIGTRPFGYQWFKDGTQIEGANGANLTVTNLTPANSGSYSVQVTNVGGFLTSSNATLTVLPDPAPNVATSLVSYWPLDEVGADDLGNPTTRDLYSRNDLILVNMDVGNVPPGVFGNSLSFDGIDDYTVRKGGFPIYNNPAYSVALWVNASGTGQSDLRFFAESSTNSPTPIFAFGTHATGADGTVRVFIRNNANVNLVARNSAQPALDGTWHHVVWTETNGQAKLYIDGVLDATDFNYTRSTNALTLDQFALGAIIRTNLSFHFAGQLDDVAIWNRVLTFTEIQRIRTNGIPIPVAAVPPSITQQPASRDVLTRAQVTFVTTAVGTAPLEFQWRKDGTNLVGQTNFSLVLSNVALTDAGDYSAVVTNTAGRATTDVARLTVSIRPPPPAELKIDFNNIGNEAPVDIEPGFSSFALNEFGPGPVTRLYGGVQVTLAGVGVVVESRKRAIPVNGGDFTQERLLQDFIFARDTNPDQGMDIAVEFLEPNQAYNVTIWSFDTGSLNNRVSNWSANGTLARESWTFEGSELPLTNERYQFSFDVTADANGKILLQGRGNNGGTTLNVFINALHIRQRSVQIRQLERVAADRLRLTIEVSNPAATHRIEQTPTLSPPAWTDVTGATFEPPAGNVLQVTFPVPDGATRFYRVAQNP